MRGDEVGLARDGELRLQSKELSFGRAVELPLFGGGVSSISVGDGSGGVERGEHELICQNFDFASGALPRGAHDLGSEGNSFLPDLEIAEIAGHRPKMAAVGGIPRTNRLQTVLNRCDLHESWCL